MLFAFVLLSCAALSVQAVQMANPVGPLNNGVSPRSFSELSGWHRDVMRGRAAFDPSKFKQWEQVTRGATQGVHAPLVGAWEVKNRMNRAFDIIDASRAQIMSELAYSAGKAKTDAQAAAMVKQDIQALIVKLNNALDKGNLRDEVQIAIRANRKFLNSLKIQKATRDAVAVTRLGQHGDEVLFGFRGTAKLRDLVPDLGIMLNSKKVKRLDEARAFTASVLKKFPNVRRHNIKFFGHSLGGYIAEGVRNMYVGARAVTIHAGAPRVFFGKGRKVRAWGQYKEAAEKAYDALNNIHVARTTRIVHHGDLVSGKGVQNGAANIYQFGRRSLFNPLSNHKMGELYALQTERGMMARNGKELTRAWGSSVDDVMRRTEVRLRDMPLTKRLKRLAEKARIAKLEYITRVSQNPAKASVLDRALVKTHAGVTRAGRELRYRAGQAASRLRIKRAAKEASSHVLSKVGVTGYGGVRNPPLAVKPVPNMYQKLHRISPAKVPKMAAVKSHVKTAAKATGKVLGKAMLLANVGHVAVESVKDYHKLQKKLAETGEVDHDAVLNLAYAVPDAFLGRGSSRAVVNATSKFFNKVGDACDDGHIECLKAAGRFGHRAAKAVGRFGLKAGNATLACAKNPLKCTHKIGKGVASVGKAIGKGVYSWGKSTVKGVGNWWKTRKERRAFCAQSAATKKQCEEEDAKAEANKARGWAKYREKHKLARVAYAPVGAVKKSWKHIKGFFGGGD